MPDFSHPWGSQTPILCLWVHWATFEPQKIFFEIFDENRDFTQKNPKTEIFGCFSHLSGRVTWSTDFFVYFWRKQPKRHRLDSLWSVTSCVFMSDHQVTGRNAWFLGRCENVHFYTKSPDISRMRRVTALKVPEMDSTQNFGSVNHKDHLHHLWWACDNEFSTNFGRSPPKNRPFFGVNRPISRKCGELRL